MVPSGGRVLDLACGRGRHTRLLLELGHRVLGVDADLSGLIDLFGHPRLEMLEIDLEAGGEYPLAGQCFAAVVVTNYLHRPILPAIVDSVAEGGVLIYETFATGNERFAGPSRLDFLLLPGELLSAVAGKLRVLAYEDLILEEPQPAAVQHIAAVRELNPTVAG
ncbi:MAG: class I SAM-dependent methyltransferase [Actinomycetota bacterium]